MNDLLALSLGVACAAIGGDLFLRGVVGLAHWARVSPGIIGATVAAFATSSPELSVAINSALAGQPQLALGDGLGSNVLNVALILGLAAMISQIQCPRDNVNRDFPVALAVPAVTAALIFDGVLSRLDGFLMLGMFVAWLVAVILEARRQQSAAGEVLGAGRGWRSVLLCAAALGFLVAAGTLIAAGAGGIALSLGLDEFIIGATLVAVGTSVPELATTVAAQLRRHSEVSLGTILGSNIFNGLFIIAVAAIIHPIAVRWQEVAVALVFGLVAVAFTFPTRLGFIKRRRGMLLLALFAGYLVAILQMPGTLP